MTFAKKSSFPFVLLLAILLFNINESSGQIRKKRTAVNRSWEIGISGGFSKFMTSVNPNSDATYKTFNYWNSDLNSAVTLSVIKNFSAKFSAEFEWMNTQLSGSWNPENGYPVPPLVIYSGLPYPEPFRTGINQFTIMMVANINQIIAPNFASDKWNLFVKGGGGEALLNDIKAFDKLPGSRFKATIAYGGGVSCQINKSLGMKLGATWYIVDTYHLDGQHMSAPDDVESVLEIREKYFNASAGITYVLGDSRSKRYKNYWSKPSGRKRGFKR